MAHGSSKKIVQENARLLSLLRIICAIVNVTYLDVRFFVYSETVSWFHYVAYALSAGIATLLLWKLHGLATPTFVANARNGSGKQNKMSSKNIVDAGVDLNGPGLTQYILDVIYISWFIQITSAVGSDYFWFLYGVIPAYAAYKISNFVKSTGLLAGSPLLQMAQR